MSAPNVFFARRPLEVALLLQEHAESLQLCVIWKDLSWRAALFDLVVAEYPGIRVVVV